MLFFAKEKQSENEKKNGKKICISLQTVAIFLYLTRVGSTFPVRFLKSASYSEYPPSNQTTFESPSKARMCVARRSRNLG